MLDPSTTCFFSVRDVSFRLLFDGYEITAITDIPVHLFMRWTTTEPQYHIVPMYRRGIYMHGDTYFCFVAYTDNEQEEPGDTLVHTFVKRNWPVCQTRWFHFWGKEAGVVCRSTTAVFKLHRTEYIPPYCFNSLEHTLLRIPAAGSWQDLKWTDGTPLKDHLPAGTKILFLHVVNTGGVQVLGLRPKGSTSTLRDIMTGDSHLWAHIGVNTDLEAQIWVNSTITQTVYLVGYALTPCIVYFTNPIDKTPPIRNSWQTVDLSAECPNATGILALQVRDVVEQWSGIRMHGSTDNRIYPTPIYWPIIGCDASQRINFYAGSSPTGNAQLFIWGYIIDSATFNTDATVKTLTLPDIYQIIDINSGPRIAFFELQPITSTRIVAARMVGEVIDIYQIPSYGKQWCLVGIDAAGQLEAKVDNIDTNFYLIGEGH